MTIQPEGNYYNKYNSTNSVANKLMSSFLNAMDEMLQSISSDKLGSILEAVCGEGNVTQYVHQLFPEIKMDAFDISHKYIDEAKNNYPGIIFSVGSIYDIKASDTSYYLIICSEVLEHMDRPDAAFAELIRVNRKYILHSVPNEPTWRILNMARGKYWSSFWNTPGHVNHWSSKKFEEFPNNSQKIYGGGIELQKFSNLFPGQWYCCNRSNIEYLVDCIGYIFGEKEVYLTV